MIKTVFIGNRPKVLDALFTHQSIDLVKAFVVNHALIQQNNYGEKVELIQPRGDKKNVVDFLRASEYTLCVSAGCPYILPISDLPRDRIFINCHPSALPFGKGGHPLNECFLSDHQTSGVSIHYLTDELDAGDVIEQITFPITNDLDVSLLYGFIFDLEADLLVKCINRLIENSMLYPGTPQVGIGTYYSRSQEPVLFNADKVTCDAFLRGVRAFSSRNFGVLLKTDSTTYKVFSAKKIFNEFVLSLYESAATGSVCVSRSDVVVVKVSDGLVRLDNWETEN